MAAEKNPKKWRQAARRSVTGEKHELVSLSGYWFKPRKYSVIGEREIQAAAFGSGAGALPRGLITKLRKASREKSGEVKFEDLIDDLTEDELYDLVASQSTGDANSTEVIRLQLLYGWGPHNFEGEDNEGASEEFVNEIMEFKELVMEAVGVIQEHNRPLAQPTPEDSETPSSTSTTE